MINSNLRSITSYEFHCFWNIWKYWEHVLMPAVYSQGFSCHIFHFDWFDQFICVIGNHRLQNNVYYFIDTWVAKHHMAANSILLIILPWSGLLAMQATCIQLRAVKSWISQENICWMILYTNHYTISLKNLDTY